MQSMAHLYSDCCCDCRCNIAHDVIEVVLGKGHHGVGLTRQGRAKTIANSL